MIMKKYTLLEKNNILEKCNPLEFKFNESENNKNEEEFKMDEYNECYNNIEKDEAKKKIIN